MSDIGRRLSQHRLSRYAPPADPVRRRLRWFWPLLLVWLAWVLVISNHSAYRLWRLQQETRTTQAEIERTRAQLAALERERSDPEAQRERAERMLRNDGMARPGEIVYRVRGGATPDTLAP